MVVVLYPSSQVVLRVHSPGLLTLFQDRGRLGYAALGVSPSGCFDRLSAARANHAVGNHENAPLLEILLGGLVVEACVPISLIVTGTDAKITITTNQGSRSSYTNTIIELSPGERLAIDPADYGFRSYLAIRGGLDAHTELGSASTDRLSGIGPAAVAAGDLLYSSARWIAEPDWFPYLRQIPTLWRRVKQEELHVILGPRNDWFSSQSVQEFFSQTFTVSPQSDRIGLRMIPTENPLKRRGDFESVELASEGMVRGAVQIPPNGEPVVFGPDHPVTGGYPVIAVLTGRSNDRAAQLAPGQSVRFRLHSAV